MKIKKSNKKKPVFYIQYCYFKYQVILFRLFNILANFQDYINKILAKKLDIFIIIHLNNIFIFIKNSDLDISKGFFKEV